MADRDAFDLFDGLSSLGRRNMGWYDSLTAEGKKAAAPLILMRWMAGTSDAAQLLRINTFVNPYVFSLGAEKPLLVKALAAAATGKNQRYWWLRGPSAKAQRLKLEVIKQYFECSTREAVTYTVAGADVVAMAEELGWSDDELKKLKSEVGDGSGSTKKAVSGSKNKR